MTGYATRRTVMVDNQVRPSDVTKFPIIDAMLSVPREAFVPQRLREAAYLGENLDLGGGRVVLLQGGIERLPDAITAQVKDGGRIACLFMQGQLGVVRIGYQHDGWITWRDSFDAGAPVLPGFEKQSEFAL